MALRRHEAQASYDLPPTMAIVTVEPSVSVCVQVSPTLRPAWTATQFSAPPAGVEQSSPLRMTQAPLTCNPSGAIIV